MQIFPRKTLCIGWQDKLIKLTALLTPVWIPDAFSSLFGYRRDILTHCIIYSSAFVFAHILLPFIYQVYSTIPIEYNLQRQLLSQVL